MNKRVKWITVGTPSMVLREYWVGEYQKRVRPGKGYSTRTRTEIDEGVRRGGLEERLIERSKQKKKNEKKKRRIPSNG